MILTISKGDPQIVLLYFTKGKYTLCLSIFTTTTKPLRITTDGIKPGNYTTWVTVCFIYLDDWSCVCS